MQDKWDAGQHMCRLGGGTGTQVAHQEAEPDTSLAADQDTSGNRIGRLKNTPAECTEVLLVGKTTIVFFKQYVKRYLL